MLLWRNREQYGVLFIPQNVWTQ